MEFSALALIADTFPSWNWNLLSVGQFEERVKPEYRRKNLSEQRREPTTNSTHI